MNESSPNGGNSMGIVALVAAVFALAALYAMYWFPVPSAALGLLAIVLGILGRRRAIQGQGGRDAAVAAIALGIVAILGNGLAYRVGADADDFGRDCLAQYSSDCPDWLKPENR